MEHFTLKSILVIIFTGLCSALEPDWSCYFGDTNCGIIEDNGTWVINSSQHPGQLESRFFTDSLTLKFSLPLNVTSPNGNISFVYNVLASGPSCLSVSTCRTQSKTEVHCGSTNEITLKKLSYSCDRITDVKIQFIMEKGGITVTPVVSVDNITVYQTPYTAPSVTAQSSTDPFTTNTHSETHAIIKEGDTTIIIHNVEAPSSNDRPMWIIPVAAGLGSCIAVIAALISVLCYSWQRNQATKTKGKLVNINGTTPEADPEVRYSHPNQPSDLVYYADIKDDLGPDGHQVPKSTAAADFKVNNPNNAISSNLVKNPVYECSDQSPRVSDPLNAEINDPVYEEAPDNPTQQSLQLNDLVENPLYGGQEQRSAAAQGSFKQPESAELQDLVDNPLYGGQDEGSRVQDSPQQAGSADSDGLVDNPLYGGQSDRSASHTTNMPNVLPGIPSPDDLRSNKSDAESRRLPPEQGLITQPEYAAVDDLIDNPLYGSQNDKPANDGVTLQNELCANDELIDNPLYGAQSTKPDGLASNLQLGIAPTEELVDNPLYGDGGERPGRQGVTSQTGMEPTDELIDNPLYGSQNESSAIGISRQESGPSDEMTDNPLYGANS